MKEGGTRGERRREVGKGTKDVRGEGEYIVEEWKEEKLKKKMED